MQKSRSKDHKDNEFHLKYDNHYKTKDDNQLKINELLKMWYDPTKMKLEKPDTELVDIKPYQTLVLSRNSW